MKNIHQTLTVTAESSIAHGGKHLGTISYLRRERFLTPSGPEEIPVISGNALRGVLRDVGAKMTWEAMGSPKLAMGSADLLWSGGSLVKAKGEPVTGGRLAEVRNLFPHIGIFGAAGGGRLIEGALSIGKLIPICQQTSSFLPAEHAESPVDMWDLLQIEEYSRLPGRDLLDGAAEAGDETAAEGVFRFGVETFLTGTTFSTWWSLTNATDAEQSFFHALLHEFRKNAFVGGRTHIGHGRIRLNVDVPDPQVNWAESAQADLARASEVLQWLN